MRVNWACLPVCARALSLCTSALPEATGRRIILRGGGEASESDESDSDEGGHSALRRAVRRRCWCLAASAVALRPDGRPAAGVEADAPLPAALDF